jgi:threonine aldolase
MLVSSTERITQARVWRKRLGGGMRQAGILAAGAAYALDHHLARLADDHAAARGFAEAVAEQAPTAVEVTSVETNIVVLDTGSRPAAAVAAAAQERSVRVSPLGPRMIRAVTHLDVTPAQCVTAGALLGELLS